MTWTVDTRARLLTAIAGVGLGAVWPYALAVLLAVAVALALPALLRAVDER